MTSPDEGIPPLVEVNRHNLTLIVGQLLEATKASAEGLRAVNAESRQTSQAILRAAQTLEITEKLVVELNRIIRLGSESTPSLMLAVEVNTRAVVEINRKLADITADLSKGDARMRELDQSSQQAAGLRRALEIGGVVLFNILTLGVAIYAAMRQ